MIETVIRTGVDSDMNRLASTALRWLWPVIPAALVVWLLSGLADSRCPPYSNPLPPHPEQCLPTLAASLTGADPWLIGISWLVVGLVIYGVVAAAYFVVRRRWMTH
jgi:hypothetical protein